MTVSVTAAQRSDDDIPATSATAPDVSPAEVRVDAGIPGRPHDTVRLDGTADLTTDPDDSNDDDDGDDGPEADVWPSSPFACVDVAFAALTCDPDPLRIDLSHL